MKAWLHIGTPKTGTTTLQKFLDTNHAALLAQRVLCANTTGELALACTENYDSEGLSRVYGIRNNIEWIQFKQTVIRELKEKVKSHRTIADYIVFSSEYFHLSLTKPSELEALKNLLHNVGITEISVVVYLREQSEFVASFYSTVIKSGGTSERPPGVSNKRYQRLCDHRLTLKLFSRVFGRESMVVRIFERDKLLNESIIDDFLNVVGCQNTSTYSVPKNKNNGLSSEGIEVFRCINKILPRWINGRTSPVRRTVKKLVTERHCDKKFYLSSDLQLEYQSAFAANNEWVRKNYFPSKECLFEENSLAGYGSQDRSSPMYDSIACAYIDEVIEIERNKLTVESIGEDGVVDGEENFLRLLSIATMYYRLGKPNQALEYFTLVPHCYFLNVDSLYLAGRCYEQLQFYSEALEYYNQALKITPDYKEGLYGKVRCLRDSQAFSEADVVLDRLKHLWPQQYKFFAESAELPNFYKDINESARRWCEVAANFANVPGALYSAAINLKKAEQYAEAIQYFDEFLTLKPEHQQATLSKASCLSALGLHERADAVLSDAVAAKPGVLQYHIRFANSAILNGDKKLALQRWRDAVDRFPDESQCLYGLAIACMRTRKYSIAAEYFEKLNESHPDNTLYKNQLIRVRDLLNQSRELRLTH